MNKNGQLILTVLDSMEQPASIAKIVRNVADALNVRPADVKKTVHDTVRAGVHYGYIQLANNKFYTLSPKIRCDGDTSSSTESSDFSSESSDDNRGDCALCQKRGGRKRRGGRNRRHRNHGRRSRSRSRSHSGRSRSRSNSRRRH